MNDPHDPADLKMMLRERQRLSRKRRLAGLVLLFENITAAFWRPAMWAALFAGLWMLRIPALFGQIGPAVALVVFVPVFIWLLRRDRHYLRRPHRRHIDQRLEEASGHTARPLEIIDDRPANMNTDAARVLWQEQTRRAYGLIAGLRLPMPRAQMAARDPWGLRFFALLMLIVGIIAAGPHAGDRLRQGLMPYQFKMPQPTHSFITLWITPPAYTGQSRLTLEGAGRHEDALSVPAGSTIKVRVNSRLPRPILHMGGAEIPFESLDKRSWGVELAMEPDEKLRITQMGIPRATIPYTLIPDEPPMIEAGHQVEVMDKGELQFAVTMVDDYGVTDMSIDMALDPEIDGPPLGGAFNETRAVMSAAGAPVDMKPVYDLSWHPWAGLPVAITFTARDFLGQESVTEPLYMILPERQFRHPVAAQLIALRKQLAWDYQNNNQHIIDDLSAILSEPETYENDIRVFLSLRTIIGRLHHDNSAAAAVSVIEHLWDVAVRIEDGNLPLAARALRTARADLEKLLADPQSTPEDIAIAMEKLKSAMGEYFRELSREMQKRLADGEMLALPQELFQSLTNPEELASFLDQLQAQALTGDRDSALQMLSQLQQLMDKLNPAIGMQMPPAMQMMQEGISELQELIENQQDLLDQTQSYLAPPPVIPESRSTIIPPAGSIFKNWGEDDVLPPVPDFPPVMPDAPAERVINTQKHVAEQDGLRYILGKLMLDADEMIGEIPQSMGLAEREMRLSSTGLNANDPAQSIPHQQDAIKYLQESMQDMSQQMAQMMKQMMALSLGAGQVDPLGRPMQEGTGPSWLPGSQVKIPDEAERRRVQDIQKKLRDRTGERERPEYELDYFRRLLRQF